MAGYLVQMLADLRLLVSQAEVMQGAATEIVETVAMSESILTRLGAESTDPLFGALSGIDEHMEATQAALNEVTEQALRRIATIGAHLNGGVDQ